MLPRSDTASKLFRKYYQFSQQLTQMLIVEECLTNKVNYLVTQGIFGTPKFRKSRSEKKNCTLILLLDLLLLLRQISSLNLVLLEPF